MIPEWVILGAQQYRNNIDIIPDRFYKKLSESKELPTSSHPSPAQFMDSFSSVSEYDEIICLVVTSKMAGTYNTASFVAEQMMDEGFPAKIYVFDSLQISLGLGVLAYRLQNWQVKVLMQRKF